MKHSRRRWLGAAIALAGVAAAASLSSCSRAPIRGRPVPAGARVLALGDSLTFGTGTTPDNAYPAVLAGLTGWEVINGGVPGDTSAQALQRLPRLLQEHAPALVLVGIGGNDLLRRLPEDALRANLRQTVALCQAAGAQVLLIAVPRPTLAARLTESLDDHLLYGEVSEALKVPLHRRGWSEVLQDASLRSDAIHANAQGYRQFAQGLLSTLQATGLRA